MEQEVKREFRTERSTAYADRHRDWGWDAPITDIDAIETEQGMLGGAVMAEYYKPPVKDAPRRVVAVMELKRWPYEKAYGRSAQAEALCDMVRPDLPVFAVEWWRDDESGGDGNTWFFNVIAYNDAAFNKLGSLWNRQCSERRYVWFLYQLRGIQAPAEILDRCSAKTVPSGFFTRTIHDNTP